MALATAGLVVAGMGTAHALPETYGSLASPPGIYLGTTPTNGDFTIDTENGIEVGLRAKDRGTFVAIDGSSGIYHTFAGLCNPVCGGGAKARWSYDFSVNTSGVTSPAGGPGADLTNFIVRLRIDTNPGAGTTFVTIASAYTNWGDNEYVNGPAYVGPGAQAGERVDTGLGPLVGEDGLQQSSNPLFPNSGFAGYDPFAAGLYDIELAVFTLGGTLLAITDIQVQVVPEPGTLAILGIGVAGLGFARRRKQSQ